MTLNGMEILSEIYNRNQVKMTDNMTKKKILSEFGIMKLIEQNAHELSLSFSIAEHSNTPQGGRLKISNNKGGLASLI
jgi:hypothetical protein